MSGTANLQAAAEEMAAARRFPVVDGASVLHVHVNAAGNFLAGGQELTPERFGAQVVAGLGLPAGRPLILVTCGAAPPPGVLEAAAAVLARQDGRWVLAASGGVYTTARGVLARVGIDPEGRPAAMPGNVVQIAPDGQNSGVLGPDLRAAMRDARFTWLTRRPGRVIRWAAGVG